MKCFICEGKFRDHLTGYDFLYKTTKKGFKVKKCSNCGLEMISPTPSFKEVSSFYPKKYYAYQKQETDKVNVNLFTKVREKIMEISYKKKFEKDYLYYLALLNKSSFSGLPYKKIGKKRFLDVGCGDGYNLNLMEKYGWTTEGFEIGEKRKSKNIFYDTDVTKVKFKNKEFDYIRVWHVLEHMANPDDFLKFISQKLSQKGKMVIGIPNTNSTYAAVFKKYWYNRDIPRHLFNYSDKNIRTLLGKHGLKVDNIKYMSAGGFIGSIQHYLNDKFKLNINLIDQTLIFLLFYPLDILSNLIKSSDVITITVSKQK